MQFTRWPSPVSSQQESGGSASACLCINNWFCRGFYASGLRPNNSQKAVLSALHKVSELCGMCCNVCADLVQKSIQNSYRKLMLFHVLSCPPKSSTWILLSQARVIYCIKIPQKHSCMTERILMRKLMNIPNRQQAQVPLCVQRQVTMLPAVSDELKWSHWHQLSVC